MKTLLISTIASLALAGIAAAGGIAGRVQDAKGRGRSGVTVTVKVDGQTISVTSAKDGSFVVDVPSTSYGLRGNVYVGGSLVTKCLVPTDGSYSRVTVTYK
jgi:outer membrane lipoprotein SlyB